MSCGIAIIVVFTTTRRQNTVIGGTTFTGEEGRYFFSTFLPVPYNAAGGPFRPAHFHLMITAEGYQPLITQLYFTGDPYIEKDPFSSAIAAKKRILTVQTAPDGIKKVLYDVSMVQKLDVEPASLVKLTGLYTCEDNKDFTYEFFVHRDRLWYNAMFGKKLDPYGRVLEYVGNNSFRGFGNPPGRESTFVFEIMSTGIVNLTWTFVNDSDKKFELLYTTKKAV